MPAIRFGNVPNPFSRPFALALERGYVADAGVELHVVQFANGSAMSAAMGRGEVDAGVGGHLQTLEGAGQVFFAPLGFERAPDHLPIALVSTVGSARELEGRAVGVSARAAISELQLRIYMAGEGADFGRLTLETMPFGEMGDAFRSGAIAAASSPDPFAAQLERDGLARVVDRGSLSTALPAGERAMIAGLGARAAWLESHREEARGLAEATGRAIDELSSAGSDGIHAPLFDRVLEPPDLQRVYDLAFEHGLIDTRPSAADLISIG
jgi:ABC-type nitrate/sulfonate/bicarbonate transport system substrate-binding protein